MRRGKPIQATAYIRIRKRGIHCIQVCDRWGRGAEGGQDANSIKDVVNKEGNNN